MLDQNQRACGGARRGGNRAGSAEAFLLSMWVRIFLITAGSSMQAMICSAPPQAEQVSMSMPKARSRRCDHVIDYRPWMGASFPQYSGPTANQVGATGVGLDPPVVVSEPTDRVQR